MDPLRWGLIGPLEIAQLFVSSSAYARYPHRLQSVLVQEHQTDDITVEGATIYTGLHTFLQSNIEAVYIASPYRLHYDQVRHCLAQRKSVLCERPVAQNSNELLHLVQLSRYYQTFLLEAMWIRFMPSVKKILSIVSSGAIGEVVSVKAAVSYKEGGTQRGALNPGGGALFELGVYPVFLCTLFLGSPAYVQASGRVGAEGQDDAFSAFLSYDEGQFGFIETSKITRGNSAAVITGNKGSIKVKNPWSSKPEGIEVKLSDGSTIVHKSEWKGLGLQFELDEVYQCLQQGAIESQLYSHLFSLDVMQTLDRIRKQLI